jgi:1-acyl-sn-glycerol-3-phosphate acyltransferase
VIKSFRAGWRLGFTLLLFLGAYLDFVFRIRLTGRAGSIPARTRWLHFWARRFLAALHLEVRSQGQPPANGVLACNHLSYVDILVLGSIQPQVFVSKSEVASWPVIGRLTRCAGTLYIKRGQKNDVVRLADEMAGVVATGEVLTLFLEGTSSDGKEVLPFRSSLLAPVAEHGWPATGAWIHYTLPAGEGSVADEVCYWRDMTFGPHLLNLLSKRRIEAWVSYGSPVKAGLDRKELARELRAEVCGLKEGRLGAGA